MPKHEYGIDFVCQWKIRSLKWLFDSFFMKIYWQNWLNLRNKWHSISKIFALLFIFFSWMKFCIVNYSIRMTFTNVWHSPLISSSSGVWHFLPLNPFGHLHVTPASPICLSKRLKFKWLNLQCFQTKSCRISYSIRMISFGFWIK